MVVTIAPIARGRGPNKIQAQRAYQDPGVEVHLRRGGCLHGLARPAGGGGRGGSPGNVFEALVGHLQLGCPDLVLLDELVQKPPLGLTILHFLFQRSIRLVFWLNAWSK